MMVGRELTREYVPHGEAGGDHPERAGAFGDGFTNVSFDLRRGEVLCFAGLVGAGRSEVWRAIFGAQHRHAGEVILDGRGVHFASPRHAIAAGLRHGPRGQEEALPLHGSCRSGSTSRWRGCRDEARALD